MLRLILLTALTLVAFASNSLLARAALAPSNIGGAIDPASFSMIRVAGAATSHA